jgi:hypothetical protein
VKDSRWRPFAAVGIIASGLCLLTAIFSLGLTEQNAASRDFIGYWAAGQQIVHGANPYDAGETLRLEKAVGLGNLQIKITPSPPIGLALVIPLGFLDAKNGLVVWLMAELGCLSSALGILWLTQGKPATRRATGYLFPLGHFGFSCLA